MHSSNDLEDGYLGSGKYLWNSIRKHGAENFTREILEFFENRKDLVEREKNLINEDFIKDPMCMNLKPGGSGGWSVEQQVINQYNGRIKIKILKETDPAWVERFFKNMSDGQKNAYKNGRIPTPVDWTGKTHSDESKKEMSRIAKLRTGDKNSSFGTCWIHNMEESKKIKQSELEQYLSNNWLKGRKMKF